MKRLLIVLTATVGLPGVGSADHAHDDDNGHYVMPPPTLMACDGKKAGEACHVDAWPRFHVEAFDGVCVQSSGTLSCEHNDGKKKKP